MAKTHIKGDHDKLSQTHYEQTLQLYERITSSNQLPLNCTRKIKAKFFQAVVIAGVLNLGCQGKQCYTSLRILF